MVAMAMTQIFSPNPIPFSSTRHVITNRAFPPSLSHHNSNKSGAVKIPRVASIPYQPISADRMEQEFSGHGVTFQDLGDTCIAKLALENGSAAVVVLPTGHITSYKPAMWHGSTDEILHSVVPEDGVGNMVNGGVSFALEIGAQDGVSCSPSNWALQSIRGNSRESIQVELMCTDSMDEVGIKWVIYLREDELSSELVISNSSSSAVQLTGCGFLSHLRVSSPEATFAIGLEGSDFFVRPPFSSKFVVIPPDFASRRGSWFGKLMKKLSLVDQTNKSVGGKMKRELDEELEGEEDDNYKNLGDEMSLIYTSAPRNINIIDRGRRNSVIVGSKGFNELYMFSPGSHYEFYGNYSYICVGQSAMLKPITVGPDQVLQLGLELYNPNL